ncbi:hypothetical protein evm_014047, partial [Chilo suppressalis]
QVHPDTGISSKAMSIMNSFVNDIFERIAAEAQRSSVSDLEQERVCARAEPNWNLDLQSATALSTPRAPLNAPAHLQTPTHSRGRFYEHTCSSVVSFRVVYIFCGRSRSTITSREVQTSVRLLLPGELAKHAVSEGTKAVTKYTSSNKMTGRGKGGKGLGKGGAKRHRKVLRDNIQGITKPAIRRLARRGGVKRISGLIYEEIRGVLKVFLENVIRGAEDRHRHGCRLRSEASSSHPLRCARQRAQFNTHTKAPFQGRKTFLYKRCTKLRADAFHMDIAPAASLNRCLFSMTKINVSRLLFNRSSPPTSAPDCGDICIVVDNFARACDTCLLTYYVPTNYYHIIPVMADTAVASETPAPATPAKKPKAAAAGGPKKPKAKPTHPKTSEMVNNAIKELKERSGSSLQAIKKYIAARYSVDAEKLAPFIRKYLKSAVESGTLIQTKGKGASGSFKLESKSAASKKPAGAGTGAKGAAASAKPKKSAAAAAGGRAKKGAASASPSKSKASAAAAKEKKAATAAAAAKKKKPAAGKKAAAPAKGKGAAAAPKAKKTAKPPTKKPKAPKPKKAAATPKSKPAAKKAAASKKTCLMHEQCVMFAEQASKAARRAAAERTYYVYICYMQHTMHMQLADDASVYNAVIGWLFDLGFCVRSPDCAHVVHDSALFYTLPPFLTAVRSGCFPSQPPSEPHRACSILPPLWQYPPPRLIRASLPISLPSNIKFPNAPDYARELPELTTNDPSKPYNPPTKAPLEGVNPKPLPDSPASPDPSIVSGKRTASQRSSPSPSSGSPSEAETLVSATDEAPNSPPPFVTVEGRKKKRRNKRRTPSSSSMDTQPSRTLSPPSQPISPRTPVAVAPSPRPVSPATPPAPTARPPRAPATSAASVKPPPVFLRDKSLWQSVANSCKAKNINYSQASNLGDSIKICTPDSNAYRNLIKLLSDLKYPYHTFALPEERKVRAVLRGVPYELSNEDILNDLVTLPARPRHSLVLPSARDIFKSELTVCGLSKVTVEPPHPRGIPGQCHRCQQYGHAAANCAAPFRCVKCLAPIRRANVLVLATPQPPPLASSVVNRATQPISKAVLKPRARAPTQSPLTGPRARPAPRDPRHRRIRTLITPPFRNRRRRPQPRPPQPSRLRNGDPPLPRLPKPHLSLRAVVRVADANSIRVSVGNASTAFAASPSRACQITMSIRLGFATPRTAAKNTVAPRNTLLVPWTGKVLRGANTRPPISPSGCCNAHPVASGLPQLTKPIRACSNREPLVKEAHIAASSPSQGTIASDEALKAFPARGSHGVFLGIHEDFSPAPPPGRKQKKKKKKGGKVKGKVKSRSNRAGLQFPVGRIHRLLRKGNYAERVGAGAPVYLAAVMEYLAAEKTRIIPRHLQLAIRNDEELNKLLAVCYPTSRLCSFPRRLRRKLKQLIHSLSLHTDDAPDCACARERHSLTAAERGAVTLRDWSLRSRQLVPTACQQTEHIRLMVEKWFYTLARTGRAAKKSGKAQKNISKTDKKKKKHKRKESYAIYIYKVLKQVHPDTGISSKAMSIMNSFVNDIFERIAAEASRLAHYNKRSTITSREVQTSVRLLLPGELAKHAVSEGTKAVTKYTSSK